MIKANDLLNICRDNKDIVNCDSAKDLAKRYADHLSAIIKYSGDEYDLKSTEPCTFNLEQYGNCVVTIVKHKDWPGKPMDQWDIVVCDKGTGGQYGLTCTDIAIISKILDAISVFEDASNF